MLPGLHKSLFFYNEDTLERYAITLLTSVAMYKNSFWKYKNKRKVLND